MTVGYAVDILDELAASIIRTKMICESKSSLHAVIWSSGPWDGRGDWCVVLASRNSVYGTVTEIPFLGSKYGPQSNSTCCNKRVSLVVTHQNAHHTLI